VRSGGVLLVKGIGWERLLSISICYIVKIWAKNGPRYTGDGDRDWREMVSDLT
jgi:hypothetical protein